MREAVWVEEDRRAFLEERYALAMGRIREIAQGEETPANFAAFFVRTAQFLVFLDEVRERLKRGDLFADAQEAARINRALYADILPGAYEESFANPAYAAAQYGVENGRLLCFLYAQLRGIIAYVFEGKLEETCAHLELFVQIYRIAAHPEEYASLTAAMQDALYWFESDYADVILGNRVREQIDADCDFITDILMHADLTDLTYLYRYGEYITDNERLTAQFLNSLPQEEIDRMAHVWSEGYRMGFVYGRKPLEKKRTVHLIYHAGFERIARRAAQNFAQMGLRVTARRSAVSAAAARGARDGFGGAVPNPQYDYDHREDAALMLDAAFSERKAQAVKTAYEDLRALAAEHGGPAVMETFGETPFEPVRKEQAWSYTVKQQKLSAKLRGTLSQLANTYIIGAERSFTIIAFPLPDIARVAEAEQDRPGVVRTAEGTYIDTERYKEIFRAVIAINTLDTQRYMDIQSTIIDALNRGTQVHILGSGQNRTDLTVQLYPLSDPERETIFENCGADVNIPVGEVFTSPVLKGTNGVLHVSQVYLEGLNFRELEIRFEDGMTAACTCANFAREEDNARYIGDNILFHHPALPMGEFAIGTNTTAYAATHRYGIAPLMPILIAEKMGPHFAVGDTCYSWDEDLETFNPDGKRIVARDNEVSILRKSDPAKAYFGCHTDITLPYEELGLIEVLGEDGYRAEILRDGRFVLPGTEELNRPLDGMVDSPRGNG